MTAAAGRGGFGRAIRTGRPDGDGQAEDAAAKDGLAKDAAASASVADASGGDPARAAAAGAASGADGPGQDATGGEARARGPQEAPPVLPDPPGEAPGRAAAIEAEGLGLTFETGDGRIEALKGVDLTVRAGEFVSFIGPSGCGKTTFLRLVAGLERPTAGRLWVNGMSPDAARRARAYGYVFQAPGLYPWRTVAANVRLPLEIMGYPKAERQSRADRALALVDLEGVARRYPWQLSGGMQQRASIARALAFDAGILLMDEPFGALDEITRDRLNEALLALWARTGKTVGFVTHSIPEAVYLSTRIVVMSPRPGRIAEVIESPLPRERPLEIRDSPEFIALAHRVREGLRAGHHTGVP